MSIISLILIIGGTWIIQDGLVSILYYLKRDNEKWYFNHLVRILRAILGVVFIVCGIILTR